MCGIIGIVATDEAAAKFALGDSLLGALSRLEYRGYDSAGVAVIDGGQIVVRRATGKLAKLQTRLQKKPLPKTAVAGIGHTRWATHGGVTLANAHPHSAGNVTVVHNGIIENDKQLREELQKQGNSFLSQTDSEVLAHLFARALAQTSQKDIDKKRDGKKILKTATMKVLSQIDGAFAFALLAADFADTLIVARQASPLAVGAQNGRGAAGSDATALAGVVDEVRYLEDGDFALVTAAGVDIFSRGGKKVCRPKIANSASSALTGKGNYRHFMEKEIHEQPQSIARTLADIANAPDEKLAALINGEVSSLTILAAGTSYYAGLLGRYWLESLAGIPVSAETAAEYRYRSPAVDKRGMALAISQSGESLDTLMAMRYAARCGMKTAGLINSVGSAIDREADCSLYTRAGVEIGVASTKSFTAQLSVLLSLAIHWAAKRGRIDDKEKSRLDGVLAKLPGAVGRALSLESDLRKIARDLSGARSCLYLGRGALYPLALEGALKLKEISYIHAEGFAGGEMKHGPIALIEEGMPVVALLARDDYVAKSINNLREAAARGAKIILLCDDGAQTTADFAATIVRAPFVDALVSPIILSLPIQLLAYLTAVEKGTDVDQPRNLAKSVTVE